MNKITKKEARQLSADIREYENISRTAKELFNSPCTFCIKEKCETWKENEPRPLPDFICKERIFQL